MPGTAPPKKNKPSMARKKKIFKVQDKNKLLSDEVMVTVNEASAILRCDRTLIYEYVKYDYLTAHCPNGPGTRPMNILTASLREFIRNYSIGGNFSVVKFQNRSE